MGSGLSRPGRHRSLCLGISPGRCRRTSVGGFSLVCRSCAGSFRSSALCRLSYWGSRSVCRGPPPGRRSLSGNFSRRNRSFSRSTPLRGRPLSGGFSRRDRSFSRGMPLGDRSFACRPPGRCRTAGACRSSAGGRSIIFPGSRSGDRSFFRLFSGKASCLPGIQGIKTHKIFSFLWY